MININILKLLMLHKNKPNVLKGTVSYRNIKNARVGQFVITKYGKGIIKNADVWPTKDTRILVKFNKYFSRTIPIRDIYVYAVYNKELDKTFLLSNRCYNYIFFKYQNIEYRITKRGFAMLTENNKEYLKPLLKLISRDSNQRFFKKLIQSEEDIIQILHLLKN